jgi:hypothetical protein
MPLAEWVNIMPTVDQMDVITGTPVRFLPGKEASGFPIRSDMSLTIRPWGQENDDFCMVIDDKGTSVPCPLGCLVIDLAHPLGFAAAIQWTYQNVSWIGAPSQVAEPLDIILGCMSGDTTDRDRIEVAREIAEFIDNRDLEATAVEAEE